MSQIDRNQILNILESMASYGTAPEEGCSLFGVGYETAFEHLRATYLERHFSRGSSAEKFVVGPFGSGKTHFLHQLMEMSREINCVTSKVTLNKDLDFTQTLIVLKEVVREIRLPGSNYHGIRRLIQGILDGLRAKTGDEGTADLLIRGWVHGLDEVDFKLALYGRMLQKACLAAYENQEERFDLLCRWLEGEMDDAALCKELNVSAFKKNELNLTAQRSLFSLYQFVRYSGYRGTVVCYDEAEQGFAVDTRKKQRILSMLMAGINAIKDLQDGAVLVVYALTPDIVDDFDKFPALQQRIADPGKGFFDGNSLAPVIDLQKRTDQEKDLRRIGRKLAQVVYQYLGDEIAVPIQKTLGEIDAIAARIASEDLSAGSRRTLVKEVCTVLLAVYPPYQFEAAVDFELEAEV
jgi:hypothetical protein